MATSPKASSGVSAVADWNLGFATLTSVSAWRHWHWDPANDADFTRLSILDVSQNADQQDQYSQELRLASNGHGPVSWIGGLYAFRQVLDAQGLSRFGAQSAYWLLSPAVPAALVNGYSGQSTAHSTTDSYAAFGQLTWKITDKLSMTPGLRYTYEEKSANYLATVSGGLANAPAALAALQLALARPQAYSAGVDDGKLSGQLNVAYQVTPELLTYANHARGYKSGGLNLAGLPVDAAGNAILSKAVIRPEKTDAWEAGLKSQLFSRQVTLNLAAFWSDTHDYQANVVDTAGGGLKQFLDNIDVARRGVRRPARAPTRIQRLPVRRLYRRHLRLVQERPLPAGADQRGHRGLRPLRPPVAGGLQVDGLHGRGIPSSGGLTGEAYVGADYNWRSDFFTGVSDSIYSQIGAYGLLNLRAGFKADKTWDAFVWVKNASDVRYFQFVSALVGNSGALDASLGDPRTVGVTLRASY